VLPLLLLRERCSCIYTKVSPAIGMRTDCFDTTSATTTTRQPLVCENSMHFGGEVMSGYTPLITREFNTGSDSYDMTAFPYAVRSVSCLCVSPVLISVGCACCSIGGVLGCLETAVTGGQMFSLCAGASSVVLGNTCHWVTHTCWCRPVYPDGWKD
jgi:hypothetical protein